LFIFQQNNIQSHVKRNIVNTVKREMFFWCVSNRKNNLLLSFYVGTSNWRHQIKYRRIVKPEKIFLPSFFRSKPTHNYKLIYLCLNITNYQISLMTNFCIGANVKFANEIWNESPKISVHAPIKVGDFFLQTPTMICPKIFDLSHESGSIDFLGRKCLRCAQTGTTFFQFS
jgi:hypothetical protein